MIDPPLPLCLKCRTLFETVKHFYQLYKSCPADLASAPFLEEARVEYEHHRESHIFKYAIGDVVRVTSGPCASMVFVVAERRFRGASLLFERLPIYLAEHTNVWIPEHDLELKTVYVHEF